MATAVLSNRWKYERDLGAVDMSADEFIIILMNNTFTFDKDTHETLADVTTDQLATGNGYTQNNEVLAGVSVAQNDTDDRSETTWDDVSWTAASGSIGPTGAFIIYDNTHASDIVMGCGDFGTDYTIPDGQSFEIRNLEKRAA